MNASSETPEAALRAGSTVPVSFKEPPEAGHGLGAYASESVLPRGGILDKRRQLTLHVGHGPTSVVVDGAKHVMKIINDAVCVVGSTSRSYGWRLAACHRVAAKKINDHIRRHRVVKGSTAIAVAERIWADVGNTVDDVDHWRTAARPAGGTVDHTESKIINMDKCVLTNRRLSSTSSAPASTPAKTQRVAGKIARDLRAGHLDGSPMGVVINTTDVEPLGGPLSFVDTVIQALRTDHGIGTCACSYKATGGGWGRTNQRDIREVDLEVKYIASVRAVNMPVDTRRVNPRRLTLCVAYGTQKMADKGVGVVAVIDEWNPIHVDAASWLDAGHRLVIDHRIAVWHINDHIRQHNVTSDRAVVDVAKRIWADEREASARERIWADEREASARERMRLAGVENDMSATAA